MFHNRSWFSQCKTFIWKCKPSRPKPKSDCFRRNQIDLQQFPLRHFQQCDNNRASGNGISRKSKDYLSSHTTSPTPTEFGFALRLPVKCMVPALRIRQSEHEQLQPNLWTLDPASLPLPELTYVCRRRTKASLRTRQPKEMRDKRWERRARGIVFLGHRVWGHGKNPQWCFSSHKNIFQKTISHCEKNLTFALCF